MALIRCLMLLVLQLVVSDSLATDSQRELAYAEIMSAAFPHELQWLKVADSRFAALYHQADKKEARGAAIILHDMGSYPDQALLAAELRLQLPEHNWSTLAIQMPVLEQGAQAEDYPALFLDAQARIQAGIDFLKQNQVSNVVLVGYGMGALMALNAQGEKSLELQALVLISAPLLNTEDKQAQTLELLAKINIPILDVYAGLDLPEVKDSARQRRVAAKQNSNFRQMVIEAADHSYAHQNGLVSKRVYGWLNRVVP